MGEHLHQTDGSHTAFPVGKAETRCAQRAAEDVVHAVNNSMHAAIGLIEMSMDTLDQLPDGIPDDVRNTLQGALTELARGGKLMRDLSFPA
jgi:hypothetical protein